MNVAFNDVYLFYYVPFIYIYDLILLLLKLQMLYWDLAMIHEGTIEIFQFSNENKQDTFFAWWHFVVFLFYHGTSLVLI